jgi:hypothetical protein
MFTAVNLAKFNWRLRVASGLVSFSFGVVLIYGIGFAEGGLFRKPPVVHIEPMADSLRFFAYGPKTNQGFSPIDDTSKIRSD